MNTKIIGNGTLYMPEDGEMVCLYNGDLEIIATATQGQTAGAPSTLTVLSGTVAYVQSQIQALGLKTLSTAERYRRIRQQGA